MDGQGFLSARTPSTLFPCNSYGCFNFLYIKKMAIQLTLPETASRIAGSIPKKGTVAEPGFVSIAPGNGVTTMEPVSVCLVVHHTSLKCRKRFVVEKNTNQNVSTIAHCFLPTCSLYQFHASGLIGSPTLPRTRKLLKS